jgi:enoyl-CoA hydratase/carnithine racemase
LAAGKTCQHVRVERDGAIAFVVLNRPDPRNAMSPELHSA